MKSSERDRKRRLTRVIKECMQAAAPAHPTRPSLRRGGAWLEGRGDVYRKTQEQFAAFLATERCTLSSIPPSLRPPSPSSLSLRSLISC